MIKTTRYFDIKRLERPYLRDEWLTLAQQEPAYVERQPDGRIGIMFILKSTGNIYALYLKANSCIMHS